MNTKLVYKVLLLAKVFVWYLGIYFLLFRLKLIQILAIYSRHSGQLFCPFLIHNSIHSVWNMCFSSQCKFVTKSFLLKSLQHIGHYFHKPVSLTVPSLSFLECYACFLLNLVLLREERISGTGKGIVMIPPKRPSINCSSSFSTSVPFSELKPTFRASKLALSC